MIDSDVRIGSIIDLDWNAMWQHALHQASRIDRLKDMGSFWDKRAVRFAELIRHSKRAERYLPKMKIKPDATILDIGAGPGTLAIPLAGLAKRITAIEPSKAMLELLTIEAENKKIKNIITVNKKWEDVSEITPHDVVIASHSFGMTDIKEALRKINDAARSHVYLFVHAGYWSQYYIELWSLLFGNEFKPGPDFIYIYNMLYEMGIFANVEIMDVMYQRHFESMEDVVAYWQEIFGVTKEQADSVVKPYMAKRLVKKPEGLEQTSYSKTAMIWWEK